MQISKFVDHYLQPHVKALPYYVQETTDFINKLETLKDKSKVSILAALEAQALYTNILTHKGRYSVKETFNNQTIKPIATRKIIKFLYLILNLKNVIFNGINYLQI